MTTVETAILTRSPPHPPKSPQTGGRWPRPRKPTAPRADGHERALRATRNPPSPHVEARKRFACLSTFNPLLTPFREMRIQCGILFRFGCPRILLPLSPRLRLSPRWLLPQRTQTRFAHQASATWRPMAATKDWKHRIFPPNPEPSLRPRATSSREGLDSEFTLFIDCSCF